MISRRIPTYKFIKVQKIYINWQILWYNDLRMVMQTKNELNHTLNILSLMLIPEDLLKNPKILKMNLRIEKIKYGIQNFLFNKSIKKSPK